MRTDAEETLDLLAEGLYSIPKATDFSALGRSSLYQAMATGRLRYVKVGRRRLIPRRELLRFLSEGLTGGFALGTDDGGKP